MINKKITPNSGWATVIAGLLFMACILTAKSASDYCSTNKVHQTIGLTANQTHLLSLGDYVKGYNLKFQSEDSHTARVWNPVEFIASTTLAFDEGYKIINVDVLQSADKKWYGQGVIFTQKDGKNVQIALAGLTGAKNLIQSPIYQKYTLPKDLSCFSAQIVDQQSNIVIDCQTTDGDEDNACYINSKNNKISCTAIDSLNQVSSRKSQTFTVGGQTFVITGTYQKDKLSKQMTYLTLYHVSKDQGIVDFVNIIDGYQLNLGYDITISDFDITQDGHILIHDLLKSQILVVEYKLPNEVSLVGQPWIYGSQGQQIQVTAQNTLLIATGAMVEEFCLVKRTKVSNYELDRTDNLVTGLQISSYGLVVETLKDAKTYISIYQSNNKALNNLLGKVQITGRQFLIAPYTNAIYLLNEREQAIHEFSLGWAIIQNLVSDKNLTITASSSQAKCTFTLQLIHIDNTQKILIKQNITNKHFKKQANQVISLNLQEIYSGKNLNFDVPASTSEVKYSLQHLNSYTIKGGVENPLVSQVVNIDKHSFYLLSVTAEKYSVDWCKVSDQGVLVVHCQNLKSDFIIFRSDIAPTLSAGKQRKTGEVVFIWTYSEGVSYTIKVKDQKVFGYMRSVQEAYDISSVIIGEQKIYFVYKKYAYIKIVMDLEPSFPSYLINNKNFKSSGYAIVGFYPREVYLHPQINDLFFVKLPNEVCLMTMIGNQPITINCRQIFQTAMPEQKWSVIIGKDSYVVLSPLGLEEISFSGIIPKTLHTTVMSSAFTFPIFHTWQTNSIVFKTVDNRIVYYKLGKSLIDSVFYEINAQALNGKQNGLISTEGFWTVSASDMKAYRQSPNTMLTIDVIGDKKSLKEDIKFSIKVSNPQDQVDTDNDITVITYPTEILSTANTDAAIKLPTKGQNKRIRIHPQKNFNGTRADYHIICDFCQSTIVLETVFESYMENKEVLGANSILEVSDNNVLILNDNRIILVDNETNLIAYKVIEHVKKCKEMSWNKNFGLLVFCQDETGQELLVFDVDNESITQKSTTYPLHQEALINVADQILTVDIDVNSAWVFIEDNDISQFKSSTSKSGNVKVFIWTEDSLQFKGVLTSKSFGLDTLEPLNDIDISNNRVIFATIGSVGMGYASLSNKRESIQPLVNAQVIVLSQIQALSNYQIDDSIYQQVQFLDSESTTLSVQILVTSSSSLPMVLNFTIEDGSNQMDSLKLKSGKLVFNQISQIFNRYGTLDMINWHAVSSTGDILLLAFYNQKTLEEYIAYYSMVGDAKKIVDISQVKSISIAQNQLLEHSVYLTSANLLFISDPVAANKDAKIVRYALSADYNLVLNYTETGNFTQIKIAASNYYSSNTNTISVKFQENPAPKPDPKPDGLQWYTIMIIVLIVLIVVGVAYGMYLKMIKHRKDKKISLLTEGEQVDEIV